MKRKVLNEVIVIVATGVILCFLLRDNFHASLLVIKNINILLFALAILLYIAVFSLEALVSMKLVKEYKKDYSFKEAFKLSLITRFFNGITPFSTGGRPLQVYELKKNGVRILDGTNVIVQNFMIFQISLILFSTLTFIINAIFGFFSLDGFLYKMTILGFVINVIILVVALIFSISKNINKKIINGIINAGVKIRLIKDKEKYYKKYDALCNDYYNAFNDFKHKDKLILSTIGIQLISLVVFYSIVICVFASLKAPIHNIIPMIIGSNFVFLAGSYVPIPGGTGGIEYAFLGYFGSFVSGGLLSSILIIWRFATYYFPTLAGGIAFNIRRKKEK